MNKRNIWPVPIFCLCASIVSFIINVSLTNVFAVHTQTDGTVTVDAVRSLILHGVMFAATFIIGCMILKKYSRKTLFVSASVIVVFELAVTAVEFLCRNDTGISGIIFMYLSILSEWSVVIPEAFFRMNADWGLWIGLLLAAFAPYLFLLVGGKEPE